MATAIKDQRLKEQGGKFRILVGEHLGQGPLGCECASCLRSEGKDHRYKAALRGRDGLLLHPDTRKPIDGDNPYDGDIIDSLVDLSARFNQGPSSLKFERLGFAVSLTQPAPPIPYPLEKMTLAQLLSVAEEEEIDLRGASKREDVLKILRNAKRTPSIGSAISSGTRS